MVQKMNDTNKYEEIEKFRDELELTNYQAANIISSLLEENKRMKEAFGEVFFEWLHLHDVADSMDLAACVEIEDHEKFEAACHRARSALKEVGND